MLLPILGDQYGIVLENGELQLGFRGRRLLHPLLRPPLPAGAPRSTRTCCGPGLEELEARLGAAAPGPHRAAVHPHRARAPARAHETERGQGASSATARRRSSSGGSPRWWQASPDGRRVRGRASVERLQRHAGRPAQLRPLDALLARLQLPARRTGGWPARRSTTAASSTSTAWPPSAWRTRRSSTRPTRCIFELARARARSRACASTTPTGCFDPTAYFLRLQERFFLGRRARASGDGAGASDASWPARGASAARAVAQRGGGRPELAAAQGALRGGGEDPGRPRAHARGLGGARHHRLRLPQRRQRALRRSRRRAAAFTDSTTRFIGEAPDFERAGLTRRSS